MVLSFSIFLFVFVVIGVSSYSSSNKTTLDYLLARHSVRPWLSALSAVATNNSGYMFIGVIGYTYSQGLQSIWLMAGWITGDLVASLGVHKKLREITEKTDSHTFAGALSRWNNTNFTLFRKAAGVISLIFLGSYAAAQLNAGSKALHVLFDWDIHSGAVIGAVIVLLYCLAGGIRASIWTDAAQSLVMILAMGVLMISSVNHLGGWTGAFNQLEGVSDNFMDLFPTNKNAPGIAAPILFITGWFFAGLGVAGQPHIMVRFMALDSPSNMTKVRIYYYTWFTLFYSMATVVGLFSRVLLPEAGSFDAELALPKISLLLLPDFATGLVLAGIFAATMSTADSLILSCSASLTNDLFQHRKFSFKTTKIFTTVVTLASLLIALFGEKSVFKLVILSWGVMAAAFVPVLIAYILRWNLDEKEALFLSFTSVIILIVWRSMGLSDLIYEVAPAVTGSLLMLFLFKGVRKVAGSRN